MYSIATFVNNRSNIHYSVNYDRLRVLILKIRRRASVCTSHMMHSSCSALVIDRYREEIDRTHSDGYNRLCTHPFQQVSVHHRVSVTLYLMSLFPTTSGKEGSCLHPVLDKVTHAPPQRSCVSMSQDAESYRLLAGHFHLQIILQFTVGSSLEAICSCL